MSFPEQPTIVSARLIMEHEGAIALLQRASNGELPGYWELPGGKVEPGEDVATAALRESIEETGATIELRPQQAELFEERLILDGKHMGKLYRAYVLSGIALNRTITLDPSEHQASRWISRHSALASLALTQTSRRALESF